MLRRNGTREVIAPFTNPLVNGAITTNALSRIKGSASEEMDTLPHNGGIITLLAVTGLTHKKAYLIFCHYRDKALACFFVIAVYSFTYRL